MNRSCGCASESSTRVPRACGDEPQGWHDLFLSAWRSPRMRG